MDLPKILENLNDYHQVSTNKNIPFNFGEDLENIIPESTYTQQAYSPDITSNNMIKRLNNLLPKSTNKEPGLFNLLAKYSNSSKICANIPTTLVRFEGKLYMLQNKKEKFIQIKQCTEDEFFNEISENNDSDFPILCYKTTGKNPVAVFSKENALELWNSSFNSAVMQSYIQSKANPITVTRVLWRRGMKNKYFTISNRKKAGKKLQKSQSNSSYPTIRRSRLNKRSTASIIISPSPEDHLSPLPESRNNKRKHLTVFPLKLGQFKKKRQNSLTSFKNKELESCSPTTNRDSANWQEESSDDYLVLTRNTESCYACKSSAIINEIEAMIDEIVDFLNSQVFLNNKLKGIVIDFIKDKNNTWFLLDSREYYTEVMLQKLKTKKPSIKIDTSKNPLISPKIDHEKLKQRSESEKRALKFGAEEQSPFCVASPQSCPFKIRSHPRRIGSTSMTEKELLERLDKVTQKIKHPCGIRSPRSAFIIGKQDGINYYIKHFSSQKQSDFDNPLLNSTRPMSESRSFIANDQPQNPDNEFCIKKYFAEAVDNFDQMKTNVKIAKIKQQSIVKKYGGADFWNKFIVALYQKILSCEILNRHFKDSKIESFEMIVVGMFKIIEGNLNLELRRRLRAAHYAKGITEVEFNCYTDIFEETMTEFKINEDDKQGITSQIRLMKSLICKTIH